MLVIVLIYIVLLIIFFVISAIIVNHSLKYGNLVPHFKTVITVFAILATITIVASLYFLFTPDKTSTPSVSTPSFDSAPSSSTSDLNF